MRSFAGHAVVGLAFVGLILGAAPAQAAHSTDLGCAACHTPHRAVPADENSYGVPLWNGGFTGDGLPTFTLYSSPTFDVLDTQITQPDGPSKLCLGCHDGTYPGLPTEFSFGEGGEMDLATSHPISFVYSSALAADPKLMNELKDPATTASTISAAGTIAADLLDGNSKMQCTSCHDVHSNGVGDAMLVKDNTDGRSLCRICHNK